MMCWKFISLFLVVLVLADDENISDESDEEQPTNLSGIDLQDLLPAELDLRIINGKEAEPHKYPFQAFLQINLPKDKTRLCGGTLLTPRYILTAAHCLKGGLNATALLGAHDLSQNETGQVYVVSRRLTIHERYNSFFFTNDIGLVELDVPVTLNENVNTTILPPKSYGRKNLNKKNATTIGWGMVDGTSGNLSKTLQEVQDVILSNFRCWLKFPFNVKKTNICLNGKGGSSACNGDSGGPLLVDGYQVGITSFGVKKCKSGYPSAFTRITRYLKWIERNTDYIVE